MIKYSNIIRHDNLQFDSYLKLEGYSHSFLKREHNGIAGELTITENIRIGKIVDAILTDPASADMSDSLYSFGKSIAYEIKKNFGDMIRQFEKQVSYTCSITHGEFTMKSTGRLDFLLPKFAVIDLKVTKSKVSQIPALIDFMGYKNQVWHYCKMAGVSKAYILIHSIPDHKTPLYYIDCSGDHNDFWAEKVINFGLVNTAEENSVT